MAVQNVATTLLRFSRRQYLFLIGLVPVLAWCIPYITTGQRIEWGDFSFFAQGYEAIRVSILEYHQFPWWNPWMSGGIPLYANPQFGVFSIQTILVLLFGSVTGIKLSIVLYSLAGYTAMYALLRRFASSGRALSMLLSLAWIFSTFFVAHLPTHYTFVWYMLAPLFVFLTLNVKNYKTAIYLGVAFAVMALSAVHNPFFHILFVCGVIAVYRTVAFHRHELLRQVKYYALGFTTLLVIAGHRIYFTYENVASFNRGVLSDPPINLHDAPYAVFMPFEKNSYLLGHEAYPPAPFSWGEATSSVGIILALCFFGAALYVILRLIQQSTKTRRHLVALTVLLIAAVILLFVGTGDFGRFTPYNVIKHLPVFGEMRVSTRWFIWFTLVQLVIIGAVLSMQRGIKRIALIGIVALGVGELFLMNFNYQPYALSHEPIVAQKDTKAYQFNQIDQFGSKYQFSFDKTVPNDGLGPVFYREYEATTFNIGVVRANEALVNNRYDAIRCTEDKGCGLILSKNASITDWTPNSFRVIRNSSGPIVINVNDSDYYSANSKRISRTTTAVDVKTNLTLPDDGSAVYEIRLQPRL